MHQISAVYNEKNSLQRTADEMGIAYAKVRKVLITLGKYSTPLSEKVYTLRSKGYSVKEIAEELGKTEKCISAWLPYEKGVYNSPDRSHDAKRSGNYRKRIKQFQRNLVINKISSNIERFDNMERAITAGIKGIEKETATNLSVGEPIRLHLRLENSWSKDEDIRIMKEYGRSSDGISITRDILVPHDITLHSLHYAIQRLYGWQNSHLHDYKLPKDVYNNLTGGTVRGWGSLIGVLFQTVYPDDAWDARYGDDDYVSGSGKTWLRKKYTGPYRYLGEYELYKRAVAEFNDFVGHLTNMAVYEPLSYHKKSEIFKHAPVIDLTLDELNASIVMDSGTEELLERLLLSSVLASKGEKTVSSERLNQRMVTRCYNGYGSIEEPEVNPVTHKLYYSYDYGDGWVVEITRLKNCDDLLENNLITNEELIKAQNTVFEKYKPVCLHQNGIFLLDDVGGFGGFIDMLRILYEPDDMDEKESMRVWASGMGWNARKVANEQML